nr:MAG TPA: hypothetical protein [Caudoviricetes sp.]
MLSVFGIIPSITNQRLHNADIQKPVDSEICQET